jgi:hypothetical protein
LREKKKKKDNRKKKYVMQLSSMTRISIMVWLFCISTITVVIGFQPSKVSFDSRNFLISHLDPSSTKSTTVVVASSKRYHEEESSLDQFFSTSSKFVSTFIVGWTLATSIALANTDVQSVRTPINTYDTMMDESTLVVEQQQFATTSEQSIPSLNSLIGMDETLVFSGKYRIHR